MKWDYLVKEETQTAEMLGQLGVEGGGTRRSGLTGSFRAALFPQA